MIARFVGVSDQEVVHPRHPGRAGDTAEPHQRHPLDVVAQPDPRGHPGLQRRHGQAGDGGRDDEVDVRRDQTGLRQCLLDRGRPELDRDPDELVVRLAEVGEGGVPLEREGEVAVAHPRVGVQPLEHGPVHAVRAEHLREGLRDRVLLVAMGWQGADDGGEVAHPATLGTLLRSARPERDARCP